MANDLGDLSSFHGLLNPNHPGRVTDISEHLSRCKYKKKDFSQKIDNAIANIMYFKE